MSEPWSIGVDLGGTKLDVAAVNKEGNVIDRLRTPTHAERGPEAIISDIASSIVSVAKKQQTPPLGVGVGTAGQIDSSTGMIFFSPNLPHWNNVPLQGILSQKLDLPVFVTNDVRAATYGEWLYGAGKGVENFVCLFIGTGIGSGIVSGGKLLTGAGNTAGELGHLVIDFRGLPCTCGGRGCLETLAGGWGVAKRARIAVEQNKEKGQALLIEAGGEHEKITAQHLIAAAKKGDPLANEILLETMEGLIAGCVSIVNALNPSRIIIGGGLGSSLPSLIPLLLKGIHDKALKTASQELQVISAELGNDAGVVGAAALFLSKKK